MVAPATAAVSLSSLPGKFGPLSEAASSPPEPPAGPEVTAASLSPPTLETAAIEQAPNSNTGTPTTIQGQTRSTLNNVKATLEAAGTTIDQAVKCTVFLVEGADFRGMNEAYREFWPKEPPARTTVVVKALVVPNAKLEIECIAAMPAK